MDIDDYASDTLSVEAQVALALGDDDADDLAAETPRWQIGGTVARRTERDRLTFDDAPRIPNMDWKN